MQAIRQQSGLLLLLLGALLPGAPAWADGSGVLQPFPTTGAFSATHREDRGAISVIEFAGNYDKSVNNQPNAEPRAVISKEFLRTHPDNYDFLVVFSTFEFSTGDALAFHWGVQNKVKGIGLPEYNLSGLFGSNGKLQGFIDMAALSRYVTDPVNPEFETVLSVLGHEVMHQWSGRVRFNQGNGLESALLGRDQAHWSDLLDSDASVLYGHKWRDNGNGSFTSQATRKFFSPLDLYLAGLYGANEVPPITLLVNPDINPALTPEQGLLSHGPTINAGKRTITVEQIIAAEGARVPSVEHAQKDFRFGFILLTGPSQTVSAAQIGAVDIVRRAFMTRFAIWTGGRATANAYAEALPEFETGAPDVVRGDAPRIDPADLSQGFAWLRSRQSTEGFWQDKPATALRDTAVTLDVLSRFDPLFARDGEALDWLGGQDAGSTDFLARRAAILSAMQRETAAETIRTRLRGMQNSDGGWGINTGFASNPLDTALAVSALAGKPNTAQTKLDAAANYLLGRQNSDGGWSHSAGGPSRTTVTTTVVQALRKLNRAGNVSSRAIAFLAGRQNADGGFGDSPSTVHDTAQTLQLLTDLDATAQARAQDAASYLLANQTASGNWGGSTYATALALAALQRLNLPNWAVQPLAVTPVDPNDGDRVRITASILNDSNLSTPATVLHVYDGEPGSGGVRIGPVLNVPALAAGQTTNFTLFWDTFGVATGAHTLVALVDPANTVVETGERDNRAALSIGVQPAPAGIDLSIVDEDVAVMPAQPSTLPADLGFAVTVRNLGLTDATGVRVQLRRDSAAGELLEEAVLNIPNRSTIAANFTYKLTASGLTRFVIVVDPGNAIAEARETNNEVTVEIRTEDSIDFAVATEDISADKTSALLGEDITFTVRLHNRGTLNSPQSRVRYFITDAGGSNTTELQTNSIQIDAGKSIVQTIVWRADRQGALRFGAELDPDNLLPETDEANNAAALSFSAGQATGPNLVVNHKDFTFTPTPGMESRPLQLNALLRNTGTVEADNIEVAFYNGDPAQGGTLIGTQTVPALAAGASTLVSFNWSAVPDGLNKLLYVVADPANHIAEFLETDNSAFNVLEILGLADLALSAADLAIAPGYPATGETVTVSARISNLGEQAANNFIVRFLDGDPAAGGQPLAADKTVSLAGNSSGTVSANFTVSGSTDAAAVFVQVDAANSILELSETNNTASRGFAVQDGDFHVSNLYISPNGDGIQETTQFSFRLAQPATVEITVLDRLDRVVRRYSGEKYESVDHAQLEWDGLDNLGRLVTDGSYRMQVRSGANVLGEAKVIVDTNRSSMLEAFGTEFGLNRNLTCNVDNHFTTLEILKSEDGFVFEIQGATSTSPLADGIYRSDIQGQIIQPIALRSQNVNSIHFRSYVFNRDGSKLAFTMLGTSNINSQGVWLVDSNGRHKLQTSLTSINSDRFAELHGFVQNDSAIILESNSNYYKVMLTTGAAQLLATNNGDLTISPDGSRMTIRRDSQVFVDGEPGNEQSLSMLDFTTGLEQELLRTGRNFVNSNIDSYLRVTWSPDGSKIAVVNPADFKLHTFTAAGAPIRSIDWPFAPPEQNSDYQFSDVSWSNIRNEFTIGFFFGRRCFGCEEDRLPEEVASTGIYVANLDTGALEQVYHFPFGDNDGTLPSLAEDIELGWKLPSPLAWVPHQNALLLMAPGNSAVWWFDLDAGGDPVPVSELPGFNSFTSSGLQLSYFSAQEDDIAGTQCIGNSFDLWLFRNLLNLTAELRAGKKGGIQLNGTAADKYFNNYTLEYTRTDNPNDWRPVQPASSQPVTENLFTTWVPATPGSYFVRLTATDLAGNSKQTVRRVTWNETPPISDLFRSPALFSPNGDGIMDTSLVQYRVLAPAHLEFNFYDTDGVLVRRIVRDHIQTGVTEEFTWDGRDNNGQRLPDGEYRMAVLNYEFFFTIDGTAPVQQLKLHDAYQFIEIERVKYVAVAPSLQASILDPHYVDSELEINRSGEPNDWQTIVGVKEGLNKDGSGASLGADLTLADMQGSAFRLRSEDGVGNRALTLSPTAAEQLIISRAGGHNSSVVNAGAGQITYVTEINDRKNLIRYSDLSDQRGVGDIKINTSQVRFDVSETLRHPFAQLFVQYRALSETQWRQQPVSQLLRLSMADQPINSPFASATKAQAITLAQASLQFDAVWAATDVLPNTNYVVRLHAIDANNNEHFSNATRLSFQASLLSFNGLLKDKENGLSGNIVLPPETLIGTESFKGAAKEIKVYLQSKDDPRYNAALPVYVGSSTQHSGTYRVKVEDLRTCTLYTGYAVATVVAADPETGIITTTSVQSATNTFSTPCVGLKAAVKPVFAESCNAPPPGQVAITLVPESLDGSGLKLLTLSTEDVQDIVFNVNQPASGREYKYLVDTAAAPAGAYHYKARLVNDNDQEIVSILKVVADNQPPAISLGYPAAGAKVCGRQRNVVIDGKPDIFNVLTLEGSVQDNNPFGYVLDVSEGNELNENDHFRIHNSDWEEDPYATAIPDSFAQASGRAGQDQRFTSKGPYFNGGGIPEQTTSGVTGPVGELFNITGDFTVRLRVFDQGGHQQCTDRSFTFDGAVDLGAVTGDRILFSPNGDGEFDEFTVNYELLENLKLDADVYTAVRLGEITGDHVRRLESGLNLLSGAGQLRWDGKGDSGSVVPDGFYGIKLKFTDGCGNIDTRTVFVEVDNTPPAANITFPTGVDRLPLMVEVNGTVVDPHLADYTAQVAQADAPEVWLPLHMILENRQVNVPVPAILATWNTFGLQGPFILRLTAVDSVANRRTVEVPVTIDVPLKLISYLEAVEVLFSPNGDKRRDQTSIRIGIEEELTANLVVLSVGDEPKLIRTLATERSFDRGPAVVTWNGLDDHGRLASDGKYTVRLTATLTANPAVRQEEEISVLVDATAPEIDVTRPAANGYISGNAPVTGSVNDANLAEYIVELTHTPEAPVWEELSRGNSNLTNSALASLNGLEEKAYALRVTATDQAQSRSQIIVPFTVDNTPPQVTLSAPLAGEYAGVNKPPLPIKGSAVEQHPARYTVGVKAPGATDFNTLVTGQTFPMPETLAQWNVSALADGGYNLRLLVEDLAGLSGQAQQTVIVDNTPPLAELGLPATGGYITGATDINGTASDANLLEYALEVAGSSGRYSPLAVGSQPVTNGNLFRLDVLPPDGRYSFRLRVKDRADNSTQVTADVTVDTKPPLAPSDLAATVEQQQSLRLHWNANSESDLAGYLLYRDGVQLTPEPITATEYLDTALGGQGKYTYVVRAVDRAGLQSPDSDPVSATIDVTPPQAGISRPANNAAVSGLLEISGTAYSADDFREYRLYVAPLSAPDALQLLRRSPVPTLNAALGEWSTLGLAEGAQYRIVLQAEDINGNVATAEAVVKVDNLPPAAPKNLTATVTGTPAANVSLGWSANTESDLLGYLVFRNDQLANNSAVFVGDLSPYAITAITYSDPMLVDGPYSYSIVAIDRAGNLSPPSAPKQVFIDTHAPKARILTPEDGDGFDAPFYVLAGSDDNDIATVVFQYSPAGANSWATLATDTASPYDYTLDPLALGLTLGESYDLRAVATDQNNRTDTAPEFITVTYQDVSPPTRVTGLVAHVEGDTITLKWNAVSATDLAGYRVYQYDGDLLPVTEEPIAETTLILSDYVDDVYRFVITAVDIKGNESAPTDVVETMVYTPEINAVHNPVLASVVTLTGRTVTTLPVTVNIERTHEGNTISLPPVDSAADWTFTLPGLALEPGDNLFTLRLSDAAGNISNPASITAVRGTAPSQPTGLTGSADDDLVSLNWNANPEADIAGYRVYNSDGVPLAGIEFVEDTTATASSQSSSSFRASNAVDGQPGTEWRPASFQSSPWLAVALDEPRLVSSLQLQWSSSGLVNFDVEGLFRGEWVRLAEFRNFEMTGFSTVELPEPYMTDQVRLLFKNNLFFGIRELQVEYVQLTQDTNYVFEENERGQHSYTVSAVNALGFESPPSEALTLTVGDFTPPAPATGLSATVDASDVFLNWTASVSDDVAYYEIHRDGAPVGVVSDLENLFFEDLNVPNGAHRYTVVTFDFADNSSAPSNEATATLNVVAPLPPLNLSVTPGAEAGSLLLNWEEPATVPAGYSVGRSTVSGGPYTGIATVTAATTAFTDSGLAGATTFYYVVYAADVANNLSEPSNEASGTTAAVPLTTPALHYPTAPGRVFRTAQAETAVAGRGPAGATIELFRDGALIARADAAPVMQQDRPGIADIGGDQALSPNGRLLAYFKQEDGVYLYDFEDATSRRIVAIPSVDEYVQFFDWSGDSDRLAFVEVDSATDERFIRVYSVSSQETAELNKQAGSDSRVARFSPDGTRLLVAGKRAAGSMNGLLLFDFAGNEWKLLRGLDIDDIAFDSLLWSPDGRYVIYYYRGSLQAVDILTGAVSFQIDDVTTLTPAWSPDGGSLLYQSNDGVFHLYNPQNGAHTELTFNVSADSPCFRAAWSPDSRAIAFSCIDFAAAVSRIALYTLENGLTTVQAQSQAGAELLQWTRSGYQFGYLGDSPSQTRLLPAGSFQFATVALNQGDNTFTAVAVDGAGARSETSEPIVVNYGAVERPDLAVRASDVRTIPAVPQTGEAATIGVTVRNEGTRDAGASRLSMFIVAPSGTSSLLLDNVAVGPLAAGASQNFSAPWTAGAEGGTYTLVVIADPDNAIVEVTETNNSLTLGLPVAGDRSIVLSIGSDAASYSPGDTAHINAGISNSGDTFSGRFEIDIEDGAGVRVERLAEQSIDSLAYGATLAPQAQWSTQGIFAGAYRAVIRLYGTDGGLLDQRSQEFTLVAGNVIDAAVSTDRRSYAANDDVRIDGTITHTDGNAAFSGGTARLQILDAGGFVLKEKTENLGDLLPGAATSMALDWNTGHSPAGSYRAELTVTRGGAVLAATTAAFTIEAGGLQVSGNLTLSNSAPSAGAVQTASFSVRNDGNAAIAELPVLLSLRDPSKQLVLQTETRLASLPLAGAFSGSVDFNLATLPAKTYTVLLQAQVFDLNNQPMLINLASADFTVQDREPPVVNIVSPADGAFFKGGAETRIFATDALSPIAKVEFKVGGGEWTAAPVRDSTASIYGKALPGLAEAAYTLQARATDAAGNTGFSPRITFTIDATPPAILIAGVADGALYNHPVSAAVTVTEAHIAEQFSSLDGQDYVSGTAIAAEGAHGLVVRARDLAGNSSEKAVFFEIDLTPPAVSISGVEDGAVYNTPVIPQFTVTDANPVNVTATLNDAPFNSGDTVSIQGVYRLVVSASDSAGNQGQTSLGFEIDTTAPAVVITQPADHSVTAQPAVDIIGRTEPGATVFLESAGAGVLSQLAGPDGSFTFSQVALAAGENVFNIHARDLAGNTGADTVLTVTRQSGSGQAELDGRLSGARQVLVWMPHMDNRDSDFETFLRMTFETAGVGYKIVSGERDFLAQMRSNLYTSLLLVDMNRHWHGDDRECGHPDDDYGHYHAHDHNYDHDHDGHDYHHPLTPASDTLREIRAMVAAGTGLIMVKTHPANSVFMEDVFGARAQGDIPRIDRIVLEDSPASSAATVAAAGRALRIKLEGATGVGEIRYGQQAHRPAMALNRYVDGNAALLGFDPATIVDPAAAAKILLDVVAFVTPSQPELLPGGVAGIQWRASSLQPPLQTALSSLLPQGMQYLSVQDGVRIDNVTAEWTRDVTGTEMRFEATVKLPTVKGEYSIQGDLYEILNGARSELADAVLRFELAEEPADLEVGLMEALLAADRAIPGAGQDKRRIQDAIEKVQGAMILSKAAKNDVEEAIDLLLQAYGAIRDARDDHDNLLLLTGRLLRAYQSIWFGLTGGRNAAPSITLLDPALDVQAKSKLTIRWSDQDDDSNAVINLYYDTDAQGADGELIKAGIREDADGPNDQFEWDISKIPPEHYYLYAAISDGGSPVIAYAPGSVTVTGKQQYNLSVSGTRFVERKRKGKLYQFFYKAEIVNTGRDGARNVKASIKAGGGFKLEDSELDFGDVPAGKTRTSTDTFSFQSSVENPNLKELKFEIKAK
ncbi:MAG TPA: CARDB domain-containing protein [Gammaproteobacteria bacterium]|nr:CARDB domain-containing protein [Gammaproteobacteria bacterium]